MVIAKETMHLKKVKFLLSICIIFGLLSGVAFYFDTIWPEKQSPGIFQVVAQDGTDAVMQEDVQKTADLFNQILQADMNITLNRDIKIFICPTKEQYAAVLQKEFHMKEKTLDREAQVTGGMANADLKVIALNGYSNNMHLSQNRVATMGHEMFHQVQAQLSHDKGDKALRWLTEGTADFLGARIAEKSGYLPMGQFPTERINALRNKSDHIAPNEVFHANKDQWVKLMEKDESSYHIADLMVFYLLTSIPDDQKYERITAYFKEVGQMGNGEKAFEKVFQKKPDVFLSEFEVWFAQQLSRPATLQIVRQDGVSTAYYDDVEHSVMLTRQLLEKQWGGDLLASQKIILTNEAGYLMALQSELGLSQAEAAKQKKSLYYNYGHTVVLNMTSLSHKEQRVFVPAMILISYFQEQTASPEQLRKLTWFSNGSIYVTAAYTVESAGLANLSMYKKTWFRLLAKAESRPSLLELETAEGWENAVKSYGEGTVDEVAELAACYLVDTYGLASIHNWTQQVQSTGDAEKSFSEVYNMTPAEFDVVFEAYLAKHL